VTVAEAAMLAGLPKAPSAYNPVSQPQARHARGSATSSTACSRTASSPSSSTTRRCAEVLRYRTPRRRPVHAEFVAETARQLVFAQYGEEAYTRGLNVYLTVNAADQAAAYRALRRGLMDYERRQVYRGPEAYIDLPADPAAIDARMAEALADHPDNDDLRAAVVLEASPRKVVAMLQSGDTITVTGDGLKPVTSGLAEKAGPKVQIRRGAVVRAVQGPKGDWRLTQQPEVEGAFVAIDPRTGAIRALVGGFDFGKSKFNHVTQAWRQPGSSFKPFIYSAALEKGFTPPRWSTTRRCSSTPTPPAASPGSRRTTTASSTARCRCDRAGEVEEHGLDPHAAVDRPAVRAGLDQRFGFEPDKHPAYLTMALGAGSVTPLQMATAYSVFANGGYRTSPHLIARIVDGKGKVLREARPVQAGDESRARSTRATPS
jgi:penicillin-binding protein 1A